MKKILIYSPKGNVTIDAGAYAPTWRAEELIIFLANMFDYQSIKSGIEDGSLIDTRDVPLHPKENVSAGEYTLLVLTKR